MHIDYVLSAANLRANIYGIAQNRDAEQVAAMAENAVVPEFTPRTGVRIDVTEAEASSNNDATCGEWASSGACTIMLHSTSLYFCFLFLVPVCLVGL